MSEVYMIVSARGLSYSTDAVGEGVVEVRKIDLSYPVDPNCPEVFSGLAPLAEVTHLNGQVTEVYDVVSVARRANTKLKAAK